MKCLLADPKPDSLRLLKSLALGGVRLTPTKDAATALRLYESLDPELVMLDLGLPYPGALNTIQEIRHAALIKKRNPIIIVLGESASEDTLRQVRMQGADGFLLKPLEAESVKKQLARFFPELVK